MAARLPIRILGTGTYLPETVRDNQYFVDYLDTSNEWILTRTGIRERRCAAKDEFTSTLAAKAGQQALDDAGLTIDDIDVIICGTATGDHGFPATATFVQAELGGRDIPSFDVGAACAGFLHAMMTGVGFLASGIYQRALVIGAEVLTRFAKNEDRSTVVLFGDGAGAAIIGKTDNPRQGILYADLGCDGSKANLITLPAGGSRLPASEMTVAERLHTLHMRGREVYKFAVNKMQELIDHALAETGLTPADLKLVIPHQSNLRIIESAREKMGLPREKVVVNIDRYGNTSAASVPMGLDEARRNGILQEGDLVLMVAIGAGLCWATMIMRL
ncbi:MAG: ketoacyl-ACP synthase III [Phycisphaerales bacterium]|nr:MAG: ketoacyl-ACP synthase III [Phycisphaerales bacterium]